MNRRGPGKKISVGKKSLLQPSAKTAEQMARRGYKLFPKHQLFLCAHLAAGYTPAVARDLLEEQYGISISEETVRQYRTSRKWKQRINRMAARFDTQAVRHPLLSKQVRLDKLLEGINECLAWRLDKIHYDKDGNELARIERRNIGPLPALLNAARIEAEGEKPLIDASQHRHLVIIRADGGSEVHINGKEHDNRGTESGYKDTAQAVPR